MTSLNNTSHTIVVLTLSHQELPEAWPHFQGLTLEVAETASRFGAAAPDIGFFLKATRQTNNP